MKRSSLSIIAAVLVTLPLYAANFNVSDRAVFEYPLDADGSLWVDNPFGNIEIIGGDTPVVSVTVVKVVRGVDNAAVAEGRQQTVLQSRGDSRVRELRTLIPEAPRSTRWQSLVAYSIRAPKTVHVKISSMYSDRIRVADMKGDVTVKNVAGDVLLENIAGACVVESANGSIVYRNGSRPTSNIQLATVNGAIQVVVPQDAAFQWVADTIQGDFRTTMGVPKPRFNGRTMRAQINGATAPVITTSSLTRDVVLLYAGSSEKQARSLLSAQSDEAPVATEPTAAPEQVLTKHFQAPVVEGNWQFATNIGNISVGEVRGSARVETTAGTINLNTVLGECNVSSHGGDIELGVIGGPLVAHTDAGNITVNNARFGGTITTGGGRIRVLVAGTTMTLKSGGGDIVVRDAHGPVVAETRSGDVTVNVGGNVQAGQVQASTARGNIVLNVRPQFAADIDATVVTSDPDANEIDSDFNGLTIRRESAGNRTKIHATGRINGGGPRVVLYAEEGDIHINVQPNVVISPSVP